MMLTAAVVCLALNVFNEARGEPEVGQLAVAHVTINRARKLRKSICDVVFEPKQFSWTGRRGIWDLSLMRDAIRIAKQAFREDDLTEGALFFHRHDVYPEWSKGLEPDAVIGNHFFFKEAL